jgi:hypothetical protein
MKSFGTKKIQISSTGKKDFSEWAGMAVPCLVSPQESLTGIEKLFLPWVLMKYWKAKLGSTYSFILKYSKITV